MGCLLFGIRPGELKKMNDREMNEPEEHQMVGSAYFITKNTDEEETHTLSVLVDNEAGVLARVVGLFSGRGYNIESLTVSEVSHQKHISRITLVTRGTPAIIKQIANQIERLIPVHRVYDLTSGGPHLERELALVKVAGKGDDRLEALRLADAFRAQVVDASTEHFVFQITGRPDKIERFIQLMKGLGLVNIARTGIAGISRGAGKI